MGVTRTIALINIAVYIFLAALSGNVLEIDRQYTELFGLNKEAFLNGAYWQIITNIFVHFDISHIGYNTIFLLIFGFKCEEIYGKRRFVLIYLSSGVVASLPSFIYPVATVSAGASGAIFGILGANLIALRRVYGKGVWNSFFYGFIFFIFAQSTGFPAHLTGLIFGFFIGYLMTMGRQPVEGGERRGREREEEKDEPLDEWAVKVLESEMKKSD